MFNHSELLDNLIDQLSRYSSVLRKSTQPFTLSRIKNRFPNEIFGFDDELIRESLIEHVGCLPIIAVFLHPYLDIDVDLGKVLIILAIHDIGETVLGDELTFIKQADSHEYIEGKKLLHLNYHKLYQEEFEALTPEAKFAKSIDKFAPDILDLLCGENYSIKRVAKQANWQEHDVMQKIRDKKRPFMLWSAFMTNFHDQLFSRFETKTIKN